MMPVRQLVFAVFVIGSVGATTTTKKHATSTKKATTTSLMGQTTAMPTTMGSGSGMTTTMTTSGMAMTTTMTTGEKVNDWGCYGMNRLCYLQQYATDSGMVYATDKLGECLPVNSTDFCPCNAQYENKCAATGSEPAFCQENTIPCPCPASQTECWVSAFDSNGMWTGSTQQCVDQGTPCPCNAEWETQCWSGEGNTSFDFYCNGKSQSCPCISPQIDCYNYSYDSMGSITGTPQDTCVTSVSQCTCGTGALPTACSYGAAIGMPYALCEAASMGSCPVQCNNSAIACYPTVYDAIGKVNMTAPFVKTCASNTTGCPCDSTWEDHCPDGLLGYCVLKIYGCPVICNPTTQQHCFMALFNSNGSYMVDKFGAYKTQDTCQDASLAQCPCNANHELTCTFGVQGMTYQNCLSKQEYSACPINCLANGSVTCYLESWTSDGMPDILASTEVCKSSYAECGALCGANSNTCTAFGTSWCQWSGAPCPISCNSATQKACFQDSFDSDGLINATTKVCHPKEQMCPCAAGQEMCTLSPGGSMPNITWCQPDTCPLSCNSNQQLCSVMDSLPDGTTALNAVSTETCQPITGKCPCGAYQTQCSEWDTYLKQSYDWCQPNMSGGIANPCPVSCNSMQQLCTVANYGTSGSMTGFTEVCQSKGTSCKCGDNALRCGNAPNTYCLPSWDAYTNMRLTCPVSCKSTEKLCAIPAYDTTGAFVRYDEYCEVSSADCNCAKFGSGVKPCGSGLFRECIPQVAYCPVECPSGQVLCPDKNNYKKDGTWLSSEPPAKGQECQANKTDCVCGLAAKKCSGETVCRPATEDCPLICDASEKVCFITNFDTAGVSVGSQRKCSPATAECPCGKGSSKCAVDGITHCFPSSKAKVLCPCKPAEQVCYVQNYNTYGQPKKSATGIRCATRGQQCPCGTNSKACTDEQDALAKICIPKFGRRNECPIPCSLRQVQQGKATCVRNHFNKKGKHTGKQVTCTLQGGCTPGRGQKKCKSGAVIATKYSCKSIYGTPAGPAVSNLVSRRLSVFRQLAARRLAAIKSGTKQSASLSFTMMSLTTDAESKTNDVKVALDSIFQLTAAHQSTMTQVVSGGEASMMYKVSNLGAVAVSPQVIATKVQSAIDTKQTDVKTALAPIGEMKYGGSGCCTLNIDVKTIVDKSPVTTTTTTAAMAMTTSMTTKKGTSTTMKPTTMMPGGTTMTTTTTITTVPATLFSGTISVALTGATKVQVEVAMQKALSTHFGVPAASMNTTATETRRLGADASPRRLPGTWSVVFEFYVSAATATAVETKVNLVNSDPATFKQTLGPLLIAELKAAGVSAADADAMTIAAVSATKITVGTISTTTTKMQEEDSSRAYQTAASMVVIVAITSMLLGM